MLHGLTAEVTLSRQRLPQPGGSAISTRSRGRSEWKSPPTECPECPMVSRCSLELVSIAAIRTVYASENLADNASSRKSWPHPIGAT
jgi:hypothetical protein